MPRPILVLGATGLLGSTLVPAWRAAGREVLAHGHSASHVPVDLVLDLADAAATAAALAALGPAVILNLAAWADVDRCERDLEGATLVNATVPGRLAALAAARPGTTLIHLGTDQVYARAGPSPEDRAGPVNVYGYSKLAGDLAAARLGGTVLRTNFFGPSRRPGRTSQSDWYAAAFRERRPITLFTDIAFSPLHMDTLAALVARVVDDPEPGIFNLGSREGMTKRDFGRALARHLGLDASAARDGLSTDARMAAPRPADTRMDCARFEARWGVTLPTLASELARLA